MAAVSWHLPWIQSFLLSISPIVVIEDWCRSGRKVSAKADEAWHALRAIDSHSPQASMLACWPDRPTDQPANLLDGDKTQRLVEPVAPDARTSRRDGATTRDSCVSVYVSVYLSVRCVARLTRSHRRRRSTSTATTCCCWAAAAAAASFSSRRTAVFVQGASAQQG